MRISDWSSDVCSSDLLLNIGEEDLKGTSELKEAATLLRGATYLPMRFEGFTEGDKLGRGDADVIVTDGFSGYLALQTIEGTARMRSEESRAGNASVRPSRSRWAPNHLITNTLQ